MKLSSENEAAVVAVLKRFSQAYSTRDADAALALFLPTDETVMIDSGEEEISVGFSKVKNVLMRQFAEWDALSFELKWGSALGRGPIAWVATVVSATDSRQRKSTGRFYSRPGATAWPLALCADSFFISGWIRRRWFNVKILRQLRST